MIWGLCGDIMSPLSFYSRSLVAARESTAHILQINEHLRLLPLAGKDAVVEVEVRILTASLLARGVLESVLLDIV